MPIQAITIDFWNTLYDSSGGEGRESERAEVVLHHAQRLNTETSPERLQAAQKATWERFTRVWKQEQRTPSTRSMVEFFLGELGIPADERAIGDVTTVFAEGALKHPPALLDGVSEALAELSSIPTVRRIALISDTAFSPGRVLKQIMEQHGIAQYFHAYSFSDETNVSKPHETAYRAALEGFACPMSQCVHIGDIERTDIAGAKALGMKAILFAGDPKNQMNADNATSTQADAKADSWSDVVRLVQAW